MKFRTKLASSHDKFMYDKVSRAVSNIKRYCNQTGKPYSCFRCRSIDHKEQTRPRKRRRNGRCGIIRTRRDAIPGNAGNIPRASVAALTYAEDVEPLSVSMPLTDKIQLTPFERYLYQENAICITNKCIKSALSVSLR